MGKSASHAPHIREVKRDAGVSAVLPKTAREGWGWPSLSLFLARGAQMVPKVPSEADKAYRAVHSGHAQIY